MDLLDKRSSEKGHDTRLGLDAFAAVKEAGLST